LGLVDTSDKALAGYKASRNAAVKELLDAYPTIIDEDKKKLGPEFNSGDYPDKEVLEASFYVSYRYVSLETPEKLEDISASIFQREKERVSQMWDSAAENVRDLLRFSLQETVDKLTCALKPSEDGSRKRLAKSTVSNLVEFLAMFDMRNITDDKELEAVVNKCKSVLEGVDLTNIKKNEEIKNRVLTSLGEVKADMIALSVKKPVRKITISSEED